MARRSRRPKCVKTYLTGQDGQVQFRPPGTDVCIHDYCPFTGDGSAGNTKITLSCDSDFRVGDCLEFVAEGEPSLDGSYYHRTEYFIVDAGTWPEGTTDDCGQDISGFPWIEVSLDPEGAPIPPSGTGGSFDENGNPIDSPDGVIRVQLCEYLSACDVRSFNLNVSREQFTISQINCAPDPCTGRRPKNRKTQVGDTEITGSATVILDNYHDSLNQRLVASSVISDHPSAHVRFFVLAETDGDGEIILENSFYVEGEIVITGISMDVNPEDVIEVTIDFVVDDVTHFLSKQVGPTPIVNTDYISQCIDCTATSTWDNPAEVLNASNIEICTGNASFESYAPTTDPGPNYVSTGAGVSGVTACDLE